MKFEDYGTVIHFYNTKKRFKKISLHEKVSRGCFDRSRQVKLSFYKDERCSIRFHRPTPKYDFSVFYDAPIKTYFLGSFSTSQFHNKDDVRKELFQWIKEKQNEVFQQCLLEQQMLVQNINEELSYYE